MRYILQAQLDPALLKALRRYAKHLDRSLSGIVRQALRRQIPARYFEAHDEEPDQAETAA